MQAYPHDEQPLTMDLPNALEKWRHCWQLCLTEGLSEQTVMAAMVIELMPRLRSIYGPERAAQLLQGLANAVTQADN